MSYEEKTILIYTKINGIYGRGHYSRMNILASYISSLGYKVLFVSEKYDDEVLILIRESGYSADTFENALKNNIHCIITDKRESEVSFIKQIKNFAPVIIIDSVGDEREFASVVIEMLPTIGTKEKSHLVNIKPYDYTILNTVRDDLLEKTDEVLVYVGEIKELFDFLVYILQNIKTHKFVIVFNSNEEITNIAENISVKNISSSMFDKIYSSFITYFGLSSFEALRLGIPTALISPTEYHESLSKLNSDMFYNLGFYKNADKRKITDEIKYFLRSEYIKERLLKNTKCIDTEKSLYNFKNLLENIDKIKNVFCDVCKIPLTKINFRSNVSNLYRCEKCQTIKQVYFSNIDTEYDKSYFTEEYKAQYGRSYEEDESTLRLMARERISVIKDIKERGSMLELGSAMGYFVKEAEDAGYDASGIEISSYAASYARSHLNVNVKCASIEGFEYEKNKYDIITAWYVLEHLPYLLPFIETAVYPSLKDKGVFAFAMPNSYGLTGRFKKNYYHSIVPKDHAYEFSIKSIDKVLKRYGFKKARIIVKGIHTKRFINLLPKWLHFIEKMKAFNYLYKDIASFLGLGDTFEAYYIKK